MSMLNLKFLRCLHSILKDISLFLCVATPIIYCVGLLLVIYTTDSNLVLVSYYAVKAIAILSVVTVVCVLATMGLGLHLSQRR